MRSQPAVADFNADGRKEIVAGGSDGTLYVLALVSGNWQVVWYRQVAVDLKAAGAPTNCANPNTSDIQASIAIGDLDNDGHLDIVVASGGDPGNHRNGGMLVYRYNSAWSFSLLSGWPQPKLDMIGDNSSGAGLPDKCWDGIWATPALGDIDGDGKLEVVVEGFDRRIHAWHSNGTYVSGWPIFRDNGDHLLRGGWSSPALGDIDGDGLPEVIVGTDSPLWDGVNNPTYDNATLWAINGDSTNVPGWPVKIPQTIQSSPVVGDINGDGRLEVVVGTGTGIAGTGGYKVYAFEPNGALATGWPQATGYNMASTPALADLNSDGYPEVIIGCGSESDPAISCPKLYAWYGNGQALPGFPVTPANNNQWGSTPNDLPYSPSIADYNGDGVAEITVVHRWATGISTVRPNGASINDTALQTSWAFYASPVIDDIDGDGLLEMVAGGGKGSASVGAIYIWNTTASSSSYRPWPMFHHDIQRTGYYPKPIPHGPLNYKKYIPLARR